MTNQEVLTQVQIGYRMPIPPDCPEPIYDMMKKCWHKDDQNRPTFEFLHNFFDDYFVSVEPDYKDPDAM